MRGRLPRGLAVAALLGLGLMTGCSGSDGDTSEPASARAPEAADDAGVAAPEVERDGGGDGSASRVEVRTRAIISTGHVTVVDDDPAEVRSELDRLLLRYGGYVSEEETFNDRDDRARGSRLTLRIPSGHFADLMAALPEIARVTQVETSAEDVSTQVIDVDSRVRTQELSLDRLRTFLARTQDVNAMIRLEGEIAQREAQLESLKAQQKYLDDQTSLGTITVSITTPERAAEEDDNGFVAGLDAGWEALQDSLVVAATVVGAVIPFAGLGALVALPVWILLRRRSSTHPPAVEAPVE